MCVVVPWLKMQMEEVDSGKISMKKNLYKFKKLLGYIKATLDSILRSGHTKISNYFKSSLIGKYQKASYW